MNPLGPINLVSVITDVGMVGCGAFNVAALNGLGYPAVKVKPNPYIAWKHRVSTSPTDSSFVSPPWQPPMRVHPMFSTYLMPNFLFVRSQTI